MNWRENGTVQMYNLNREQALAKILDEVICLWSFEREPQDLGSLIDFYSTVELAVNMIAEIANEQGVYPVTLALALELKKRELLPREPSLPIAEKLGKIHEAPADAEI